MKFKVFIDGAEGTTGLKIHEYFSTREDIEVLGIDKEKRKDPDTRLAVMKLADVSFLCLPDAAAGEIAAVAPKDLRLIDTSTKHRTNEDWVYGLPELKAGGGRKLRDRIRESSRIANPGCHATGVITLLAPLIQEGVLAEDACVSITSLTGYSGGGKKMIAAYEDLTRKNLAPDPRSAPAPYALAQSHKHIPEIMKMSGLLTKPSFLPVVADFYSGMQVLVPLHVSLLQPGALAGAGDDPEGTVQLLQNLYQEYYADEPMIGLSEETGSGSMYANRMAGSNRLEVSVHGDGQNVVLAATFDNLGKGASGAAVQNMNIMLGIEETKGLI